MRHELLHIDVMMIRLTGNTYKHATIMTPKTLVKQVTLEHKHQFIPLTPVLSFFPSSTYSREKIKTPYESLCVWLLGCVFNIFGHMDI